MQSQPEHPPITTPPGPLSYAPPGRPTPRLSPLKPLGVVALALVMGTLIHLHVRYVNGPYIWPWPWRTIPKLETAVALCVAAIPFFAAQWVRHRFGATWAALAIITVGCFVMKLASVLPYTDPPSLEMIRVIVENRYATSYYTDAAALYGTHDSVTEWLPVYHEYMPQLSLHTRTKAPGAVLYYTAIIHLFGGPGPRAAMAGGILIGLVATLSIPATYLLIRALTRDREAAFCGASFLALAPGFVLFFPMMDPTYILLSCALVGSWAAAVERDDWRWAAALGAALAVTSVITFNVLVIGMFMAAYPVVVPVGGRPLAKRLVIAIKQGAVAVIVWLVLLALAQAAVGYDVIGTFLSAWQNQHALLAQHAETRPYPLTIPFDLQDFALGSGFVSVLLVIYYFATRLRRSPHRDAAEAEPAWRARLSMLCVAQLVAVAATGLLQLETARVWNFMLPLLMIPIGLELRHWPMSGRMPVYLSLWFVMVLIAQNIKWIY